MMPSVGREQGASQSLGKVSEDALIGEMKGGRGKIIALVVLGLAAIVLLVVMIAR
jgi:hypothetical protein